MAHIAIILLFFLYNHNTKATEINYVACPTEIISEESSIESPLFPEYLPYFHCEYRIQAPKGYSIIADFKKFEFPRRTKAMRALNYEKIFPQCEKDFLEISDYLYDSDIKFKYCGKELDDRKFFSRGRTLKISLQTMNENFKNGGFRAHISFKKKNAGSSAARCSAIGNNIQECKLPLKRVMTPESSVELFVTRRQQNASCTKHVTLTKEPLERLQKSNSSELDLDALFEGCSNDTEGDDFISLGDRDSIVYKVKEQNMPEYEFAIGNYSTKQFAMCGGVIRMKPDKKYKIRYSGRKWSRDQSCLWIIHADKDARTIAVEIDAFDFGGHPKKCDHHLSMMYISSNMFELMEADPDLMKNTKICKKIDGDKKLKKRFNRPNRDIYGGLSIMMLLSHTKNFKSFSAQVSCV